MSHFIALQPSLHQNAGFTKVQDYRHAAKDTVAPVVWEEISQVTANIPVCFIPGAEKGRYQLVALQGLQAQHNLLVHPVSQKWMFGYIPSHYRGYPFALINEQDSQRQLLCIDRDSGLLHETPTEGCEPLFDEQGDPSPLVKNILQFLELRQTGLRQTQAVVDQLVSAELLTPWNIQLQGPDGESKPLQGLYKVDEEKLKALDPQALQPLVKSGALMLAYAQLLSEARLSNLQKAHQAQVQFTAQPEVDLDEMFGDAEEDIFKF